MSCIMKIILKSSPILTVCFLLLYSNPCLAEIQLLKDKPLYALTVECQYIDNGF